MTQSTTNGTRKRDREVLDAAAQVFHRHGFAAASVQQVAEALGMLKGSLYYYIRSKDDLLRRLLDETNDELMELSREVRDSGLDAESRLREFVRRSVQYNVDNLARISVYYDEVARLDPQRKREIYADQRESEQWVTDVVRELRPDAGENVGFLAMCVFSTIIHTYRWYRPSRFPGAGVAEQCADFAVRGVLEN